MRTLLVILLFSSVVIAATDVAKPARVRQLSFRNLPLRKGERVAAIQIDVTGAAFQKVSIPYDWGVDVSPPVSDACRLKATAQHGAAFLTTLRDLQKFVMLAFYDTQFTRPFSIEASVVGYSYDRKTQKEEQRVIKLPKECIVIE